MTKASYEQKASIFYRVWKANKNVSISDIQNRYKGTKYAMRKQDIADLLREWKSGRDYQTAKTLTRHSRSKDIKRFNYPDTDLVHKRFTRKYKTESPHGIDNLVDSTSYVIEDFEYLIRNVKHSKAQIQLQFECEIDKNKRIVSTTVVTTEFYSREAVYEQLEAAIDKVTQSVSESEFNWVMGAFHVWR